MKNKLTSVEWLQDQLKRYYGVNTEPLLNAFNTAKEMEKQQIIDAYTDGLINKPSYGNRTKTFHNEIYKLAEESYLKNKLQNSNAIEKANYIAGFIEAYKLNYSEEIVLELWDWLNDGFMIRKNLPTKEELIRFFEQFKK